MAERYTFSVQIEGVDQLTPVLRNARRQANRAASDINSSLGSVGNQMQSVSRTGRGAFRNLSDRMDRVGRRAQELGGQLQGVGIAMAGLGAGITGGLALGVREFASFEQAMANVRAVSGATDEEFEALNAEAKRIGETMGRFTAQEAAGGLNFLAMAGLDARQSIDALEPTLQLAQAAQVDMAQAGDILTNVMTGMRIETSELERVNDVLIKGFTSANTDLRALGEAFSVAAGSAQAAGLSVEETTAILGKFAGAGIRGSRAGTTLEAMMRQMSSITPQAQEALDELGVSLTDAQGNFRSMPNIVRQFEKALADVPGEADRLRMLNDIFGEAGARGMNALIAQGSEELKNFVDEMNNAGGTSQRVADIQTATLQESFGELTSAISGAALAIGQHLAPAVESLAGGIKSMVSVFNNLNPTLQAVVSWFLALSGILLTVSGGMILLLGPLGSLMQGFSAFMKLGVVRMFGRLALMIMTRVVPAMIAMTVSMGPIGIALAALAAVVAAFALAWANDWFGIRDKTKAVIDFIVGYFRFMFHMITTVVGAVVDFVKDNWQEVVTVLATIVAGPLGFFLSAWATNAFGIRDIVSNLVDSIKAFFGDLAGNALDMGKDIIEGLWEGIKSAITGLLDRVGNIGGTIKDAVTGGLGDLWPNSPSKAGVKVGRGLMDGVSEGVRRTRDQVKRDMEGVEAMVAGRGPNVDMRARVSADALSGGRQALVIQGPLVEMREVNVRDDRDLDEIPRRINREISSIRVGGGR